MRPSCVTCHEAACNLGRWHGIVVLPHEDDFENEEDDVENDKDVENDDNCALVVPLVKRQLATRLLAWQPVLLRTTLYLSPSFLPTTGMRTMIITSL